MGKLSLGRSRSVALAAVMVVLPVLVGSCVVGNDEPDTAAVAVHRATTETTGPARSTSTTTTTAPTTTAPPTTAPPTTAAPAAAGVGLGNCPSFPADNHWHASVAGLPVHPQSGAYVNSIGAGDGVKADFGSGTWDGGPIGIPVTRVAAGQAKVPVSFDYADESDPGPYPIPGDALVEGGPDADGDRHVLVIDGGSCQLYELFDAHPNGDGSWHAGSGSVYDLRANDLRPAGWTSADAAGLPITPGLVRYEEVAAGHIDHAIRVTVPESQNQYLWPARHAASDSGDAALPPMGLRLRLKAGVDLSGLAPQARVVAEAMQTYGVIVADNGSPWYISGVPDEHWDNDGLQSLGSLTGSDFEAVDASSLMVSPDSAQARG
ncbi:MAG TPA: hypothetical protein VGO78_23045 [Acidimicrobiales bacterium]|nr:hypothetical protein [Acidimicrobiales bacterium]